MTRFARLSALLFGATLAATSLVTHASSAYARFPAIRGDNIVFTAEGDLWKVAATGGRAQRLTTHPDYETNAALSHDGQWVAFSASYEAGVEAYVMPVSGGIPKRISFAASWSTVLGWTAQGEVLVSNQHEAGPSHQRVVAAIDPKTLARKVFPLTDANEAVLDDDGKTIFFTRFGAHTTGDNARRYRGGARATLWRYELGGKAEAVRLLPKESANARAPMWWKGRVYYISDGKGVFNLYSMKPDGSDARALTSHTDWDVRNPALGDGRIAYQLGADLHLLDLAGGADRTLAIDLVSDFDQMRAGAVLSPLQQLTHVDLAGKSERIVVTARGHITVAGTGVQRRIDVQVPRGARARNAVFAHDDKAVYAIVDSTGENEIWKFPIGVHGDARPEQLTTNKDAVHRWNIYPSPDGKWLAHSDKRGRLWLLDLASKADIVIDNGYTRGASRHSEVVWAHDGKTLALVRNDASVSREQIALYSIADKKLEFITSDKYDADAPLFSKDGKWLYFMSSRSFQLGNVSPWGDRNMGPVFDKRVGVYALALQAGNRFPFKPDDELGNPDGAADKEDKEGKDGKDAKDSKDAKPAAKALPAIQFEGLAQRLYQVPLAAGNYRGLATDDKRLYFMEQDGTDGKHNLKTLAISKASPQPELFVAGVRSFDLSRDAKRIHYRSFRDNGPGDFMIVEAGAKLPGDISKAKVALDDWTFRANPREEWRQMFADAWRMHRDYLFDNAMRGIDWNKTRAKYAPMVERVADRQELNDVLAMMMGELGTMHSQVRPGELRRGGQNGAPAALGAMLERVADGYRIAHIYRTDPDLPGERAPLAQPGLDVHEGDIIIAVNGSGVAEARDISDLLINQAGKQVVLRLKRGAAAPKSVIVSPVSQSAHGAQRYSDWELERSERVLAASQGKIGYLHLRAMGQGDIASFARDFYSHVERDGLVIDVRRNTGGNIDSWIIEKLLRKAWAFWIFADRTAPNMQQTFRGHLVVITDELTYSDGETLAAGVKALKLGTLVGKRTSGAGVWLSSGNTLSDNGVVRAAEVGQYGADGSWIIEGVGVAPDVEVDNMPHATFMGADQQLDAALRILQDKIKAQPIPPLAPQKIPALE